MSKFSVFKCLENFKLWKVLQNFRSLKSFVKKFEATDLLKVL